jgi:hypothetical protein
MIIDMVRGWKNMKHGAGTGAVYGLGFIGAAIYYLQNSTTFVEGVVGILKSVVWPALVVYKVLEFWKM